MLATFLQAFNIFSSARSFELEFYRKVTLYGLFISTIRDSIYVVWFFTHHSYLWSQLDELCFLHRLVEPSIAIKLKYFMQMGPRKKQARLLSQFLLKLSC